MQIMNSLKKLIMFQERELDWWLLTLFPIILMVVIGLFIFSTFGQKDEILIKLSQQLLSYSVVLSSTDLALKSKDRGDARYQISPNLLIIIISGMSLIYLYTNYDLIFKSNIRMNVYLSASIILAYFSIFLYNNNPNSSHINAETFTKAKEENENDAKKTFESPKIKSKLPVKWGE